MRTLEPAYFALVMATGIVSIACELWGFGALARGLSVLNLTAYATLWALTLVRVRRHARLVLADLSDHARGVGFFTMVAATGVLGAQLLLLHGAWSLAAGLWGFAALLWSGLTYGVMTALTVRREKPDLSRGLHGGWLLLVVATQSLAVLGAQLAPGLGEGAEQALALALVIWLGGGMLYFWIISLIFYRYTFLPMSPADLTPPYWINMGAAAISTLAGALLAAHAPLSPLLTELLPFLKGFTVLFFASATWWIPMLVLLGFWRHAVRRFPLRYHPHYWGAVFPLGMYSVCSQRLAEVLPMPFLSGVSRVFLAAALVAWVLTFAGLLRRLIR